MMTSPQTAVADAFGVELHEHPDIIAIMAARWRVELTRPAGGWRGCRRRTLVKNSVQGPPGFQIDNVFVLAGVPQIMRGMLEDVGWRLRAGAVVIARKVRVDGAGEGVIAEPLETVAKAHPAMSLGSYPFFGPEGYGSNLVVRGREGEEVEATVEALVAALAGIGAAAIIRVEA